jgi:large conductance mechanosensitive channel
MNSAMEAASKEEEEAPEAPPEPSKEEVLLGEIRDELRSR